MLFSSLEFLYLFLPLTLVLYFAAPRRARNFVLLLTSLVFYGVGEPSYILLMLVTIATDYGIGLAIMRWPRRARPLLWSAVAFHLAILGFFKYYNLFASLLPFLPTLSLRLPIGISFYTFQALSYVIDVYRGAVAAQRNAVSFGAYVTLFPQLVAGPIVRYADVDASLSERRETVSAVASGVRRFCVGLAKKVLLANPAGALFASLTHGGVPTSTLGAWGALVAYAFQIYFDFSGYSDMAIGLGRLFGFEFPENFRYPYVAKSITEFWRRWHITLSTWFREYVYIPLGGNRRGKGRTVFNLFVTWSLTGLWHGASWNFLAWGLYFFALLVLEKFVLGRVLDRLPRPFRHAYAIFLILIGWLIFTCDGTGGLGYREGVSFAASLFGVGTPWLDGYARYELLRHLPLLCIMALGCTPLPARAMRAISVRFGRTAAWLCAGLSLGSLLFSTAYLVNSGYNPFLYFRF